VNKSETGHALTLAPPANPASNVSNDARAVAPPADRPFDGVIALRVDTTDVQRRIFTVHQRIPVANGGTVTLLYPRSACGTARPAP
jgi:hypothetical protein